MCACVLQCRRCVRVWMGAGPVGSRSSNQRAMLSSSFRSPAGHRAAVNCMTHSGCSHYLHRCSCQLRTSQAVVFDLPWTLAQFSTHRNNFFQIIVNPIPILFLVPNLEPIWECCVLVSNTAAFNSNLHLIVLCVLIVRFHLRHRIIKKQLNWLNTTAA